MHVVTGLSKELLPPVGEVESGDGGKAGGQVQLLECPSFPRAWEPTVGSITVPWRNRWPRSGMEGKERTGKMICCLSLSISDLQEYAAD